VGWWLRGVTVLDSDESTARTWGEISAYARKRGRPRPDNDSWIAACCLAHGLLPLLTANIKDFADYAQHEGLTLVHP
jgi:toxin FitB